MSDRRYNLLRLLLLCLFCGIVDRWRLSFKDTSNCMAFVNAFESQLPTQRSTPATYRTDDFYPSSTLSNKRGLYHRRSPMVVLHLSEYITSLPTMDPIDISSTVMTVPTVIESEPIAATSSTIFDSPSSCLIQQLDLFFKTQPYLAAFVVTSFKASTADLLAQTTSSSHHVSQSSIPSTALSSPPPSPSPLSWLSMSLQQWLQDPRLSADTTSLRKTTESTPLGSNDTNESWFSHAWNNIQSFAHQHITQPDDDHSFDFKRNVAFLLYGGLYQGMFLQFLYTTVYPYLYGSYEHHIFQIHTDILLFGPFLTLPLAYVIKSVLVGHDSHHQHHDDGVDDDNHNVVEDDDNRIRRGLQRYKEDVIHQNLLATYWSIWAPAQYINFTLVPPHLRVFFVAIVSFVWVFMLSLISADEKNEDRQYDEDKIRATKGRAEQDNWLSMMGWGHSK